VSKYAKIIHKKTRKSLVENCPVKGKDKLPCGKQQLKSKTGVRRIKVA
jgi:hypothetical protein